MQSFDWKEFMILYRPVGLKELELIAQSGFRAFPPRLEIQPIFYPVMNFEYAAQIAGEWNPRDPVSGYVGFVTKFEIDDEFGARYPVQTVGDKRVRNELWVPAEELEEFNQHIKGKITVEAAFTGPNFAGEIDSETNLPINLQLNP